MIWVNMGPWKNWLVSRSWCCSFSFRVYFQLPCQFFGGGKIEPMTKTTKGNIHGNMVKLGDPFHKKIWKRNTSRVTYPVRNMYNTQTSEGWIHTLTWSKVLDVHLMSMQKQGFFGGQWNPNVLYILRRDPLSFQHSCVPISKAPEKITDFPCASRCCSQKQTNCISQALNVSQCVVYSPTIVVNCYGKLIGTYTMTSESCGSETWGDGWTEPCWTMRPEGAHPAGVTWIL